MLRSLPGAATLVIIAFLAGCSGSRQTVDYGEGTYTINGNMQKTSLEGGCWIFVAGDGARYELTGGGIDRLLQDGLQAELVVRDMPDTKSICMAGKVVLVVAIISTSP